MIELSQADQAKELGFWPATAKGWTWRWQRCGRYDYRKYLTHSTIQTTGFPARSLRRIFRPCG
jgi:hypothetical protein